MPDRTTDVIYNLTGQTVTAYPPEWLEGRPSSINVSVYRGDGGNDDTAEFTAAGQLLGTNKTITAASGYSQAQRNKLFVSTATDLYVGRTYRLANAFGQVELVTLKYVQVTSPVHVLTEHDLAYDYTTSDTLENLQMSFTVDATWVADESNLSPAGAPPYRVIWSYTLNGIARRLVTYLRLVRQTWKDLLTIEDVKEVWPDITDKEWRQTRGQQFAYMINAAGDALRVDIITAGYDPERIRDTEILKELHRAKFFALAGKMGIAPPGRDAEVYAQQAANDYQVLFQKTIGATTKVFLDEGTEGAASAEPVRVYTFRR